jgi:poly(3-hydroxybutyrate) depolymerase
MKQQDWFLALGLMGILVACPNPTVQFTVTANAGLNGLVSPPTQKVNSGATTTITVTANAGFSISSVTGCGGTLSNNTYTTAVIGADCAVNASFAANPPAATTTTGTTNFAVTGAGVLQASRTSRYRVSGVVAPVGGRPLVIYLHGDGDSNVQVPSAYTTWTDAQAAVLVSPQGLNATWRFRMDGKDNAGAAAEVDDVAFIKEIITRGSSAANPLFGAGNKIDSSKVFVIGESRGAGFAYYLYAHPDTKNLITAIAPISGTFYCATSNGGNGTTPYNPPNDSDFTCGENGGFGYFGPKSSLYTRASAPRIFAVHGSDDLSETAAPALDNQYGTLILMTKQWAATSNNCGNVLPSANPVFSNASINKKTVSAYKQRNTANTAPCAADVTFFVVQGGGHVPSGYAERITKWFFEQYNTQTNTFN